MALVVLMLSLMISAGFWQLDRAEQKIKLLSAHQNRAAEPLMKIIGSLPPAESIKYRRISIRGEYDQQHQFLLDNRSRQLENGQSQPGYEVLTLLQLSWGGYLLVNRGWLAASTDRAQLPALPINENERQVSGIINIPEKGFTLGEIDTDDGWPRRIQYIDFEKLAARLQLELYPAVLMLDANAADGYRRDWQPVIDGPAKHYSYAIQWFAMALATLVLFGFATIKRKNHEY